MRIPCATGVKAALLAVLCMTLLLPCSAVRGEVPPEVQDLTWCPGQNDCLNWLPADGATSYALYRGNHANLIGLLDSTGDSCTVGSFTTTTADVIGDPGSGFLYWYLVTASNLEGQGSAGQGSTGPRGVDSSGPCGAAGDLVINEIDYDQPGSDFGEFVEVYNAGAVDRELAGLALILVNGLSSSEYARVEGI